VIQRFDIGFLGGGQLARMSIQAAQRMGLRCLSLDPGADTPASQIAASIVGPLGDPKKIAEILRRCDRVTLENEFILADDIEEACEIAKVPESKVIPIIGSLDTIQDKLRQRKALIKAGVPSPRAVALESDPANAIEKIGFPMMIKTRFGGYDGKGAMCARTYEELEKARSLWDGGGWLAEEFVPFARELAVMVYIGASGSGCFPTMEPVRVTAIGMLGSLKDRPGESRVYDALVAVLKETSFGARSRAISSLAQYGNPAAMSLLDPFRTHSLVFFREAAEQAIASLGSHR